MPHQRAALVRNDEIGGETTLSEKEKAMLDQWARLPEALQDRFLDRLQGAADALDAVAPLLAAAKDQRPEA